jgi:thiol-disulfide isomerase/thioredoxin
MRLSLFRPMILLLWAFLPLLAGQLFANTNSLVHELDPNSAQLLTDKIRNTGEPVALVLLQYASWCGHCRAAAPIFSALAAKFPEYSFAAFDCAAHRGAFCVPPDFGVLGFPTIRLVTRGNVTELAREEIFGNQAVQYLQDKLAPYGATPRENNTLEIVTLIRSPVTRW